MTEATKMVGKGTLLGYGVTPTNLAEVVSIDGIKITRDFIEVSVLVDAWREQMATRPQVEDFKVVLFYEKDGALYNTLLGKIDGPQETWTITFPDTTTFVVRGGLKEVELTNIEAKEAVGIEITIAISGEPTFTEAD